MPHKNNPVRSALIRRAALTAGPLATTLHTASALSIDERVDGGWHAEWATLRTLARHTVTAAVHATKLMTGLTVHADRAAANLTAAADPHAEQRAMTELTGRQRNSMYLGVANLLVGSALNRARRYRKDTP